MSAFRPLLYALYWNKCVVQLSCLELQSWHPSLLASLTTSVTLAMLWLPTAPLYHTTLSETPSGCQHLPSANSHTMEDQMGYHSLWSLDTMQPSLYPFLLTSVCHGISARSDSQRAIWAASHKSSFCSELRRKGISSVSRLAPNSSVCTCPEWQECRSPLISF